MSRKKLLSIRKINSDYKFNSELVSKFINLLMLNGKKLKSEYIFYKSLNILFNKINDSDINIFNLIIDKIKPLVEVRRRKIGGSIYQIPTEIKDNRKITLAIRWIIHSARKRSNKFPMFIKLSDEFIDILNNKGMSLKKKDDMHKIAESNKAFSYYKW